MMKKIKKFLASPKVTLSAFVLAAVLLLLSSIGGARAALTYYSNTYASRLLLHDIGITLVENNKDVAWNNYAEDKDHTAGVLLSNALAKDERWQLGKAYPEELKVRNSGTINQYVRVNIYKYWLDKEGNKMQNLSPDLIDLNLINIGTDWLLDEDASTSERTVLYYNKLLYSKEEGESVSVPFSDTITIDGVIASKVTQTEKKDGDYTIVTTTYDYNGIRFQLEVWADAVQEHNAQDAILSSWGRKVTIENNTLNLN